MATATHTDQDARLQRAKDKANKPKKSKFGVVPKAEIRPQDQSDAQPQVAASAEDQKALPPTTPVEGEVKKVKKAKKPSKTVIAWRAMDPFPLDHLITQVVGITTGKNPKAKDAARRYALYEEGMTVGAYIEKAKTHQIAAGLASQDVRWDHVKGIITVIPPPAKTEEPKKEEAKK